MLHFRWIFEILRTSLQLMLIYCVWKFVNIRAYKKQKYKLYFLYLVKYRKLF